MFKKKSLAASNEINLILFATSLLFSDNVKIFQEGKLALITFSALDFPDNLEEISFILNSFQRTNSETQSSARFNDQDYTSPLIKIPTPQKN